MYTNITIVKRYSSIFVMMYLFIVYPCENERTSSHLHNVAQGSRMGRRESQPRERLALSCIHERLAPFEER